LSAEETQYLDASIAEHEAQRALDESRKAREAALERRSRNRLRTLVGVLFVAMLGALGLTALALGQRQSAIDNAATAQANFVRAENLRLVAEANSLVQSRDGNAELATLLALRSLKSAYSSQADDVLGQALARFYTKQVFAPKTGQLQSAVLSPDGKYVLTGSTGRDSNFFRLWDAETGAELRQLPEQGSDVLLFGFSPDGLALVMGNQQSVWLSDLKTDKRLRSYSGFKDRLGSAKFSPNGQLLPGLDKIRCRCSMRRLVTPCTHSLWRMERLGPYRAMAGMP
jgi:hypothetical protein